MPDGEREREGTSAAGLRYAVWLRRSAASVLLASSLAAALGGFGIARLHLKTSFQELLPSGDAVARALDEAQARIGDLSTLVVAIRSPDRKANVDYAAALAPRISALGPNLVEQVIWRAPELRAFLSRYRWLYLDEDLLGALRDRLRLEVLGRENPLFVELDEPPTLDALRSRIDEIAAPANRMPDGILQDAEGRLVALVILPSRSAGAPTGVRRDERLLAEVRRVVASLPPGVVVPGSAIEVSYGGEVNSSITERRAVVSDVALTSLAVVLLVSLVVALYFGRVGAVPLVALPALVGADLAMGFAGITFHVLNASTAFLGSIIIGNGINYPILLLARYDEERRAGRAPDDALDRAVVKTARPTALAAFAASLAYGSLGLTRFRGFNQFGIIGAVGMALCWAATFTLLPALLHLLDGRSARPPTPRRVNYGRPFGFLAGRHPAAVALVGTAATLASVALLPRFFADPFEYDFHKLSAVHRGAQTSADLDAIFGRILSPSLLLAKSPEEARVAKRAILERAARLPRNPVAHAVTVDDLLPGSPEVVRRKLELCDEIRSYLRPERIDLLSISDEQRRALAKLRPPDDLAAPTLADLPPLALRPFRERDGTLGRVVLIYSPRENFSLWDGHNLFLLASVIRDVPLPDGKILHTAGRPAIFASMIQAIARDGPRATVGSFVAVALLTLLLAGLRGGSVPVLGSLCLGVLWLLGTASATDTKLNFLNFIALPITFGIGIDYGANVFLRYALDGRGSMPRVLRTTGGAVMLNSATTIIGYGSLLVAQNRALRSFGWLAILGEVGCVAAALLVLPSLMMLADLRRSGRASAAGS